MKKLTSLLILTAMICTFVAGVALAEEQNNLITAIAVKGNQAIPTEQILSVVKTKAGQKIENEKLRSDMQAIFDLGHFFNVQIEFESYKNGVKLNFVVVENPKVKEIAIKGTLEADQTKLKELMKTQVGQMLNTKTFSADLKAIEEYFGKQGKILAYIEDVSVTPEGALTITVNEGLIHDITLKGNKKTKDYVILREMSTKAGDVFDLNRIQQDLQKIGNLGYFDNVQPRIERVEGTNKVDLVIEVEEHKTGNLQLGAGYSSKDGLLGYFEITEQNLLGRAQKLGFKWEFGQTTNYEVNFYDPWMFGKNFSLGADLYSTTRKALTETGSDGTKYTYDKKSTGGSVQVGKPIYENILGSIKFKYENTNISYRDGDDAGFEPDKESINKVTQSVTLGAVRDTTDNAFNPHTGNRVSGSIEYAGQLLGGDNDFTKYNLELAQYTPGFKSNHTWAFRLKTGFSPQELLNYEKYTVGGSETLRGYKANQFAGNKMLLLNAEYRIPIVKSVEGVVFTDSGYAWEAGQSVNLKDMKLSAGAGVRLNTPLGQIRLDYAFGDQGGMPHFSIGQSF